MNAWKLMIVLAGAFLLAGCSTLSDIENPKPFLVIPLAKGTSPLTISQGWLYSPDEVIVHPGTTTHFAADFSAKWGTPVYSPANGLAVASYHTFDMIDAKGRTIGYGLGEFVQILIEDQILIKEAGVVYTSLCHLSRINNELIPYIAPVLEDGNWQPRAAIYVTVEQFKRIAKSVKRGDLIGYVGYTGLRLGYEETPANPPTVNPEIDKTWDPAGAHLHWEVYTRKADGSKGERYDPFGIYGYREAYTDVFTKAQGLILANLNGSPKFAR